ncbi:MAG: hypothetical protein K2P84_08545 [Undibacterium sp.]|nr:hypothetical protein [Undibacterium sp.]
MCKLHLDTADCGVVISELLTSTSVHDSQAPVALAMMSAERVTNFYDVMDTAYCSEELREHSRILGHVPLIDQNPSSGEKKDLHRMKRSATKSVLKPSQATQD